ncbi:uroporphyrinogen-III C-methyltransferase [Rhodobacterales bacterium 52_120_T64]|nr:uroporphyrinogen-III C-methyltransferase [Rhodobacterales bacterium 52_120_T64]
MNALPTFPAGEVWLVGAGPGDAGLLTLHAVNALKQADVIVHDALVSAEVLGFARDGAELVFLGKRGGQPSPKQSEITARLIEDAGAGKRVLRLKGGDPFMFGRGAEEALDLVAANIPFRIIPGITAGIGGLAYAGVPVTSRDVNSSVIFLTGHDKRGISPDNVDWAATAKAGMIVMYMAMRNMGETSAKLIAAGRPADDPVMVVSNATLPDMQVVETTLERAADDIAASGIGAPAIVSIGRGNLLREQLNWHGI